MIKSRYYSPEELQTLVSQTEDQLDRMQHEARLNEGIARLEAYMAAHPDEVANDPLVKSLRALPARPGVASAPAVQPVPAPAAPAPAQTTAPTRYKTRADLEREKPWLAPRKPEVESVIDPYAGRKTNRIRIG
jgi:hypothetical protein